MTFSFFFYKKYLRSLLTRSMLYIFHSHSTHLNCYFISIVLYFQPSTIENLAVFIWQNLRRQLERPELLYEIELTDNQQNSVVYNGSLVTQNKRGCSYMTSDTD